MSLRGAVPVVALSLLLASACGKTSDSSQFSEGDGGRAGDGGDTFAAGSGATTDAGRRGVSGSGSGSGGDAGAAGVGGSSTGSDGSVSGGASGGASSGGTASGGSGDLSTIDPHADERRRLAAEFCSLLETYPCLDYYGSWEAQPQWTREELIAQCRLETEVQESHLGGACWDEWVALVECAIGAPYACPCEGDDCLFGRVGEHPGGATCWEEDWERRACSASMGGKLEGQGQWCTYIASVGSGCEVYCVAELSGLPDVDRFEADCTGPAGGAQSCTCKLNGAALCDEATSDSGCYPWYAEDCVAVAEAMAAGQCRRIVDCCFTWTSDGTERCSCTADPTAAGFASCEAAAAAGGGEVVDLCPRYEPVQWDFPDP